MTKKTTQKPADKEVQDVDNSKEEKKNTQARDKKSDKESEENTDKQTKEETTAQEAKSEQTDKDAELEDMQEKFEMAKENAAEWHDKYIRLSAEFDNYRKRTLKEKADLTKQANGDLLKDILPVIDDFERGHDNLEKATDLEGVKEGINLIYNKFVEFLRQNGIKEIDAREKDFDIDFHEALTKIPAPTEDLKGKVVDVIEKGYLLNEKVIRYAKVVVGE